MLIIFRKKISEFVLDKASNNLIKVTIDGWYKETPIVKIDKKHPICNYLVLSGEYDLNEIIIYGDFVWLDYDYLIELKPHYDNCKKCICISYNGKFIVDNPASKFPIIINKLQEFDNSPEGITLFVDYVEEQIQKHINYIKEGN